MSRNPSHIRTAPYNVAAEREAERAIIAGSTALAREINRLRWPGDEAAPCAPRSFAEQLAMVERGQARVVDKFVIPAGGDERTLAGVVGEINL